MPALRAATTALAAQPPVAPKTVRVGGCMDGIIDTVVDVAADLLVLQVREMETHNLEGRALRGHYEGEFEAICKAPQCALLISEQPMVTGFSGSQALEHESLPTDSLQRQSTAILRACL